MKIYTRSGDDGTTGLFFGGRVGKDAAAPWAYGTVDEAQAALGVARALVVRGSEIDSILVSLCRDLYVAMAELATLEENHHKLTPGTTSVTTAMVEALELVIDELSERFSPPTEFVIPGQTLVAAQLDVARTVVRRAERLTITAVGGSSVVVAYLNRLSDLCWTLARWVEADEGSLPSRGGLDPR